MKAFVAAAALTAAAPAFADNLNLLNSDFEVGVVIDPDGVGIGHANLPFPWTSPAPGDGQVSGDTWSHLGAPRGLFPTVNGVFPGSMLAYNGDRWAGGWSFEFISQELTTSLVEGNTYTLFAAIHASNLGSGGSVEVSFGNSVADRSIIAGVFPGTVTLADGWQLRRLDFVASQPMSQATWFHYRSFSPTGEQIYMAVDSIPAPSVGATLALGAFAAFARRRPRAT